MTTYTFDEHQLRRLLTGVLDVRQEFLDVHGYDPERAAIAAVIEITDGLDAERELFQDGEIDGPSTMQILTGIAA